MSDQIETSTLYTCTSHTDDYPTYDIRILLKDGGKILLRSTSNCDQTLPWNITDGKRLYASYDKTLPEAVFALIGRKTSHGLGPGPEPPPPEIGAPVTMDSLFTGLTHELTRLLADHSHSGSWAALHTEHLVSALAWMDNDAFRARLEKLSRDPATPPPVRRHAAGLITQLDAPS